MGLGHNKHLSDDAGQKGACGHQGRTLTHNDLFLPGLLLPLQIGLHVQRTDMNKRTGREQCRAAGKHQHMAPKHMAPRLCTALGCVRVSVSPKTPAH